MSQALKLPTDAGTILKILKGFEEQDLKRDGNGKTMYVIFTNDNEPVSVHHVMGSAELELKTLLSKSIGPRRHRAELPVAADREVLVARQPELEYNIQQIPFTADEKDPSMIKEWFLLMAWPGSITPEPLELYSSKIRADSELQTALNCKRPDWEWNKRPLDQSDQFFLEHIKPPTPPATAAPAAPNPSTAAPNYSAPTTATPAK